MIKLFSSTNCSSSKKMRQWLIANKLEFTEVSILENSLFKNDILRILSLSSSIRIDGSNRECSTLDQAK